MAEKPQKLTPEQKIAELEKKMAQAKAKLQKQIAVIKSREANKERQSLTRKKVLVGAWIMDGGDPLALLNAKGVSLQSWLTRPEELALFGLQESPAGNL